MNVFTGESKFFNSKYTPTAELKKFEVDNFKEFCERFISTCLKGRKNENYITIGSEYDITPGNSEEPERSYRRFDHYHRNNQSQKRAWLLPFDGDSSTDSKDSCIPPVLVHETLKKLNLNHVIYTTHSHKKGIKNRWRLFIPCKIESQESLTRTINQLFNVLKENGCEKLTLSAEGKNWSQPWFLPTRQDPTDGEFEYYYLFDGEDYQAIVVDPPTISEKIMEKYNTTPSSTIEELIQTVVDGAEGTHHAIRNLAYGYIKDGMKPATVKATISAYTIKWDLTEDRLRDRKADIPRAVDSAVQRCKSEGHGTSEEWEKSETEEIDIEKCTTDYPDQGGVFEELVQYCMQWQRYPNRQLAIISCHALISVLGGRVYTFEKQNGIIYTALITGPSTSGKGSIKLFCIHMLDSFDTIVSKKFNGEKIITNVCHSCEFMGPHSFTSAKNIYDSIKDMSGSVLCIFTESGQSGQSKAGDMTNVALYELELANEHGEVGKILPKGQNEKVPTLFSPALTIIRESNFELQNEADIQSKSAISGMEGRRSRINIGPKRANENRNRNSVLPEKIKKLLKNLYTKASEEKRHKIAEPYPPDLWVHIKIEDEERLFDLSDVWNVKREEYLVKHKDHYTATFYGRLKQRVLTYGARLAIAENPDKPVVTNKIIDTAIRSLEAEAMAYGKLRESSLSPWDGLISLIVNFFSGELIGKSKTIDCNCRKEMLKKGACALSILKRGIMRKSDNYDYLQLKYGDRFEKVLLEKLAHEGIYAYTADEARKIFNARRGTILYRG